MKSIDKLNRYLLKRYPTIWNTRLIPVMGISLVVHFFYFLVGFLKPTTNNFIDRDSVDFTGSLLSFHVIISILILMYWVVRMSRNNAFKNYYPVTVTKLFSQFLQYNVIIIAVTTFYFSYQFGLKAYAILNLSKPTYLEEVKKINEGAIFLAQDSYKYSKKGKVKFLNYDRDFLNPYSGRWYRYRHSSGEINKRVAALISDPNHRDKITKILSDFLEVAKKYKIKTNLTVDNWLCLIYQGKEQVDDVVEFISRESDGSNALYFDDYTLRTVVNNTGEVVEDYSFLGLLHFFVWFALGFSVILFALRTTGTRALLLSIVFGAIISIVVGLLLLLLIGSENSVIILPIFVCFFILIIPYLIIETSSKSSIGIFINQSYVAYPLMVVLIIVYLLTKRIVTEAEELSVNYWSCFTYILTLLFVYFQCAFIKKWQGMPDSQ